MNIQCVKIVFSRFGAELNPILCIVTEIVPTHMLTGPSQVPSLGLWYYLPDISKTSDKYNLLVTRTIFSRMIFLAHPFQSFCNDKSWSQLLLGTGHR